MRIVGGIYKGRALSAPEGNDVTRPTYDRTREAIMSSLLSHCALSFDGMRVLDLFAGSGACGFEFLSRGAAFVQFVDTSQKAIQTIRKNARDLQCDTMQFCITRTQAQTFCENVSQSFDIVFLDPPYATRAQDVQACCDALLANKSILPKSLICYERLDQNPSLDLGYAQCLSSKRYGKTAVDIFRITE